MDAAPARGLMECQVMSRTRLHRLILAGALAATAAGLGGCVVYPVGYAGYGTYRYDYAYSQPRTYSYPRYYSQPRYYGRPAYGYGRPGYGYVRPGYGYDGRY